MLLTCASEARRRLPVYGIRRRAQRERVPAALADVPSVTLGPRPGRDEVDPILADHPDARLIVHGTDADLAAVLVRLLRKERLGTEVGYVPVARRSVAAAVWGLPLRPDAAAELARHGVAGPVPLVRDDAGGVLVGRGEMRDFDGEGYCDATLVLRGRVRRLLVDAGPDGVSVLPDRDVRAAVGRAVQIGTSGARVTSDGVEHPREIPRWAWYRHTEPWHLVRP
ncbi:MAG: hypothetical protein ABW212_11830 [Pseudonocardia sediminis]